MRFKDVMVDEGLKRHLAMLADENRISHAQLFLGKNGTHNFALAVAFAQYICCEDRHDGDSCGECHSCKMFEKLQHPDLHLIFPNCIARSIKKDPESDLFAQDFRDFVFEHNYHIDFNDWVKELKSENKVVSINIRDCASILRKNSTRAYENGYKIFILWMAEKLHHTAAPKLLKTLEEPENKTLFILLAENSDAILPTILSRTQLVKIPQLPEAVIKQHLIDEEGLDEEEAADIAAISENNYAKALSLKNESLELHQFQKYYTAFVKSASIYVTSGNLEAMNYPGIQDIIKEISKSSKDFQRNLMHYFSRMFRNELLISQRDNSLVKATEEELKVLETYAPFFTLKNAQPLCNLCDTATYHLERNANTMLVFTDLYFKLAQYFAKK